MNEEGQVRSSPTGILIIDKPLGASSMYVCRDVRRRLVAGGAPKRVKVGHGGTLDPLATGVLVLLIGRATRMCDRIMAGAKRYLAEVDLAHTSTTDDREGTLEPVHVAEPPSQERVREVCARFVGTTQQTPPIFSAMKVGGRRAYDLARRGQEVTLQPRPVRIDSIDVVEYAWPRLVLDVRCGKGTYIRSLARDVGAALGTGGCLAGLRRTEVAPFSIDEAVTLASLPQVMGQEDLREAQIADLKAQRSDSDEAE